MPQFKKGLVSEYRDVFAFRSVPEERMVRIDLYDEVILHTDSLDYEEE